TSIVLDSNDRPSISFYEYKGAKGTNNAVRMRVVSWTGKAWEARTVDSENQSGKFNAMDIDAQSNIHLAYANVGAMTSGVRYALWDGTKWTDEIVDDQVTSKGEYVGYSTYITLDSKGNPHVVYANYGHPSVRYAFREGTHWVVQVVDTLLRVGYPDRY